KQAGPRVSTAPPDRPQCHRCPKSVGKGGRESSGAKDHGAPVQKRGENLGTQPKTGSRLTGDPPNPQEQGQASALSGAIHERLLVAVLVNPPGQNCVFAKSES